MAQFNMLISILALTVFTVCRAQRRPSLIRSHDRTDAQCLNGGTAVTSLVSGKHIFCLCPDGFKGPVCEIDESVSCYDGIGVFYSGPVSRSTSGRECLRWNSESLRGIGTHVTKLGLGRHNSCRNPDYSSRPWCYVQTQSGIIKEDCDIPHCINHAGVNLITDRQTDLHSGWKCGLEEGRDMKVVGGALSTVEHYPWMAAVFTRRSRVQVFSCGGSLISPCWVLTAAHCFPDGAQTNIHKLSVVLGKNAVNETDPQREQKFRVSELIIHENFDNTEGNFNNDIALLKIGSSDGRCATETSSVKMVCLPDPELSLSDGTTCDVTGYGKEQEGLWHYSQYLREAKVSVLSHDLCSSKMYYGNLITDNMLCAGSKDWSSDTCKGDSGGPLVCRVGGLAFQFGVVSWGEGCSRKFRPGVYAKVSNYYHWILEKTGQVPPTAASAYLRT